MMISINRLHFNAYSISALISSCKKDTKHCSTLTNRQATQFLFVLSKHVPIQFDNDMNSNAL